MDIHTKYFGSQRGTSEKQARRVVKEAVFFFHIPFYVSFVHIEAYLSSYKIRFLGHIFYVSHKDLWFVHKVLKIFLFKCAIYAIRRKDSLTDHRERLQIFSMDLSIFI